MPRGFLVKRLASSKHSVPASYRVRRYSDEDRSDSSSDHDVHETLLPPTSAQLPPKPHASPDSGFGSPTLLLTYRTNTYESTDADTQRNARFYNNNSSESCDNSPLALTTRPPAPSFFNQFDQYVVSLCTPPGNNKSQPIVPPPSPHKRRGGSGVDAGVETGKLRAPKKSKAVRRLTFDEDKTSPVSGTIIRDVDDVDEPQQGSLLVVRKGDIDPSFNVVEATEEAKAEIAKIENRIGDYICQLCKKIYDDAFGLAQHRCSRIIHVEYRCPECDKVFNCPANLASHRRWHKPRPNATATATNLATNTPQRAPVTTTTITPTTTLPPPPRLMPPMPGELLSDSEASNSSSLSHPCSPSDNDESFGCDLCLKKFRRQTHLRKHLLSHGRDEGGIGGDEGGNGPFVCKFCPNAFATSPGLTRHINKFHPSETRQVILLQLPQH